VGRSLGASPGPLDEAEEDLVGMSSAAILPRVCKLRANCAFARARNLPKADSIDHANPGGPEPPDAGRLVEGIAPGIGAPHG